MRLEFHPEAELDLIETAVFYDLQVPGLGERFEAEVVHATELLLEQPMIGRPTDPSRVCVAAFSFHADLFRDI